MKAAGCQTIRSEKKSGTERAHRTELQILLDFLREGDTLVVTRIDRLARSMMPDLANQAAHLEDAHWRIEHRTDTVTQIAAFIAGEAPAPPDRRRL